MNVNERLDRGNRLGIHRKMCKKMVVVLLVAWGAAGRLVVAGRHTARIDALLGEKEGLGHVPEGRAHGQGPGEGLGQGALSSGGGACARLGLTVIPAPAQRNRA